MNRILPQLFLVLLILQGCSAFQNYSIYELLSNQEFSENTDELSNDYFKTLLDMRVQWKPNGTGNSYEAFDRVTGEKTRTASRADLVFGSNSQLRALVEVYATEDNKEKFVKDFVSAWNKVMNADLF